MYFRYFVIISPSKWVGSSHLNYLDPFIQGCFVPGLVEIGQEVLEKNIKMKSLRQRKRRRRTTDNFDQKSLLDLSAKVS